MANLLKNFISSLGSSVKKNPISVLTPKKTIASSFVNSLSQPKVSTPSVQPTKPVVPTSNTGATSTKPTAITPPKTSPSLPPAGQQYAASLANTPATPAITTPGASTSSSTASSASSPQSAYLKYLTGIFDEKTVGDARTKAEEANLRASDAASATERASVEARKGYQANLDRIGGLKSGAEQSAQVYGRRASDDVADLALAESAAARSAQVANDTYKSYIDAGKSVYEAETAAAKAKADSEQQTFDNDLATKKYNEDVRQFGISQANDLQKARIAHSGSGGGDELLSVSEAKQLGVPYGTTKSQAVGKRSLTAPQLEAQTNANSALLSLSNLTNAIRNPDGSYSQSKLLNLGLGQVGYAERELRDIITRIRTGAALNKSEESFYKKQVPRPIDSDATIKAKTNQLIAFYSGISGNPVTLELPDGTIVVADDMYDSQTRTDVRKAIADGANIIDY